MKTRTAIILSGLLISILVTPLNSVAKNKKKISPPQRPKITISTKEVTLSTRKITGRVSRAALKSPQYTVVKCSKIKNGKASATIAKKIVKNGRFTLKVNLEKLKPGDKIKVFVFTKWFKGNGEYRAYTKNGNSKTFRMKNEIKSVSMNINDKPITIKYRLSPEKRYEPYHGAADIYSVGAESLKEMSLVKYSAIVSNVTDEESAVKIAAIAFAETYRDCLKKEMPFEVFLNKKANAWIVHGTLPINMTGGVTSIAIEKDTGEILMLLHTK